MRLHIQSDQRNGQILEAETGRRTFHPNQSHWVGSFRNCHSELPSCLLNSASTSNTLLSIFLLPPTTLLGLSFLPLVQTPSRSGVRPQCPINLVSLLNFSPSAPDSPVTSVPSPAPECNHSASITSLPPQGPLLHRRSPAPRLPHVPRPPPQCSPLSLRP